MTTVKNSRHVNTNTPFIRRRNAAVRKSFAPSPVGGKTGNGQHYDSVSGRIVDH